MAATKVLVVYSISQKIRRRLIVLNHQNAHDGEFHHHLVGLLPGEGFFYIPIEVYNAFGNKPADQQSGNTVDHHVASILGNPENDHCALVDSQGNVLSVCCADPLIDKHPDGTLIELEKADPAKIQAFRDSLK